ncbi:MAG: hypothetical protein GKS06_06825 [Acidobacteria bacterium]|nr:hypothetical protein [Acidobacteriota bacterium]
MSRPKMRGHYSKFLDVQAAACGGIALTVYGALRVTAPDAAFPDAAAWLESALYSGLPALVFAALAGFVVASVLGAESTDSQRAIRPVFAGAGFVLAAFPLRLLFFHDVTPLLLLAGVGLGGLAAGWRLIRLAPTEAAPRVVGLAGFAVTAALAMVWLPPQGDEPHYLIVAHSIVEDGDLDVADDYDARVFAGYHPDALSPHTKPGLAEGTRYSMHGARYALFLAPAYALGKTISPALSVLLPRLQQAAVFGIFAWILAQLVSHVLGNACTYRGTLSAVLLAPLIFAPLHLFPETPAMTLAAGGVLLLIRGGGPVPRLAAGMCLAALPWLGVKYLPLMAASGLAGHVLGKGRARDLVPLAVPLVASVVGHGLFTWTLYGSLSPSSVYLGADPAFSRQPGYGDDWLAYLADWPVALATLAGYFLDQKEGLLAIAPQFVVVPAGLVLVWRHDRVLAGLLCLVVAAHLGPYALSQQLGGQSPPARPLMAIGWALAIPMAAALSAEARAALRALRGGLIALGVAVTTFLIWDPTLLPHDFGVRGSSLARALAPQGWELWRWLPSWVNVSARPIMVNASWLIVVAGVAVWVARDAVKRRIPEDRYAPARPVWVGATVAWAALLMLGLGVATVPVSNRARGVEVAPGLQAWAIEARPETIWPETAGIWVRPGSRRDFVIATASAIPELAIHMRSLVPSRADAAVGAWAGTAPLDPARPFSMVILPGEGHPWRDRRVYRAWISAHDGAAPAALDGGADWRHLGARIEVRRVEDAER